MFNTPSRAPLSRWERLAILLLVYTVVAFGLLVLLRGAFLQRRMCDLGCFQRAAWAVRTGGDIYDVIDDNGWHYNYPPLFAILFTPLADPPFTEDHAGYVPHAWSVVIFYVLNVICLCVGVHVLASALQERSTDPAFRDQPTFCRRWWALRFVPVLICLSPIGHTLMRGQVNILILSMLCAALACWLRGLNFRAGLWLAVAICIKVIPAYLLVYPLWKRDGKALLGSAVGLVLGLVIIPGAVFGPEGAITHYQTYSRVFFGPLLNMSEDTSRKKEIVGVNATDSVGVKNAIHNWMYRDPFDRPQDMHGLGKVFYLLLGFAMTFLTLWPTTRQGERAGQGLLAAHPFAGLIVLMTIFSPVSHSHYLMFCLPITMCLLAKVWESKETLAVPRWLVAVFVIFVATMAVAYLPGLEILKDRCAALFATLPLWAIPMVQTWQAIRNTPPSAPAQNPPMRAAA
ncbi:MAG: DUF2029 domain-containing protein [Planctomycetes bacterium]|nr:DUF2029 domain-containing protein [Planctomycetota bacterium]